MGRAVVGARARAASPLPTPHTRRVFELGCAFPFLGRSPTRLRFQPGGADASFVHGRFWSLCACTARPASAPSASSACAPQSALRTEPRPLHLCAREGENRAPLRPPPPFLRRSLVTWTAARARSARVPERDHERARQEALPRRRRLCRHRRRGRHGEVGGPRLCHSGGQEDAQNQGCGESPRARSRAPFIHARGQHFRSLARPLT